jgi:L-threonylcarbamoyladenylate synthase
MVPDFEPDIKNSIDILEKGKLILYPTDTIWGIGCDALNETAIEKVFRLKKRPADKSLIVLLAEPRDIFQYVASPPPDIISIIEDMEQPTTVIYENALGFPDSLIHENGSIAIRVTNDPFCKALIKRFRRPIVSTSANLSGQPAPKTFAMVSDEIKQGANYIVKHRQNDTIEKNPSRLIRIHDDGTIDVLR